MSAFNGRRVQRRSVAAASLSAALLFSVCASAAPPSAGPPVAARPPPFIDDDDYRTKRLEPAGFPLLAGNSDIGFEFGVVGTLTRFADGVVPYRWNMDWVVALAVKNGPAGKEITQQSYLWNIDVPAAAPGQVRFNPQFSYSRTINQLFFGRGNASSGIPPAGAVARFFEFDDRQARARVIARVALRGPVALKLGSIYRFEDPHPYTASRLAVDGASGSVRGVRPMSLLTLAGGLAYDTRDNEVFPLRGGNHHLGLRGTVGVPLAERVRYGAIGAQLAQYVPLGGSVTLALRAVTDLQFGNVPVYDLYTGGAFLTDEMIGGSSAVRGVPKGRYSGLIKLYGNVELRAMLWRCHLLGQRFGFGGNVLFDTGRLWSDYGFRSPLDGPGLGLKWGAGGGAYLQWGQAAVFRVEIAYSPDARSGNPNLPLGIYVEDGVMF